MPYFYNDATRDTNKFRLLFIFVTKCSHISFDKLLSISRFEDQGSAMISASDGDRTIAGFYSSSYQLVHSNLNSVHSVEAIFSGM